MAHTSRMTSGERREQLIRVGRSLFAKEGFRTVSVEEIAKAAKISKPIVYEHFSGKEGLYAVIVDREMRTLTTALNTALNNQDDRPRELVEKATVAFLTYIEENSEGFQILVRDSPATRPDSSFSSLLGDISARVEYLLTATFPKHHIPVKSAQYYAQMLVGMIVFTGQYWSDHRKLSKERLASYIVNLAWRGLSRMDANPVLRFANTDAASGSKSKSKKLEVSNVDSTSPDSLLAESFDADSSDRSEDAPSSAD